MRFHIQYSRSRKRNLPLNCANLDQVSRQKLSFPTTTTYWHSTTPAPPPHLLRAERLRRGSPPRLREGGRAGDGEGLPRLRHKGLDPVLRDAVVDGGQADLGHVEVGQGGRGEKEEEEEEGGGHDWKEKEIISRAMIIS